MNPTTDTDSFLPDPESSPLSSPHPSLFESSDDNHELNTTSLPRRQYNRRVVGRRSNQNKLQRVVDTLKQCGWSFEKFLLVWAGAEPGTRDIKIRRQGYRHCHSRVGALFKALDGLRSKGLSMRHTLASIVIEEFGALIQKPYFNRSDHTNSIDDINFSEAFQIIEETAPEWHAFLKQLLNNTRAHRSSYATSTDTEEAISKRIFTITSIVCHSRARQQSNYLASTLAAYMMGSGTKRRVLEVLAGLGICHGYRQTRRLTNEVAQESVVCNPLSSDRDS